jgi:excisionase family DNA binding protein
MELRGNKNIEPLLNNQQAAELLNVSPHSLRGYVSRGMIPHVKIGRRTLFDPAELRAYIESRKVPARNRR